MGGRLEFNHWMGSQRIRASTDVEFLDFRRKITEDTTPVAHQDIELLIRIIAATPEEAMDHVKVILRKQGIQVQ